jgi:hypothetical protein
MEEREESCRATWQEGLHETIAEVKRLLADDDAKEFTLTVSRQQAILWLDYLETMDPDMPRRPVMKALGPLVGEYMMNDKLHRLNELADKLGPAVVQLSMIAERLESGR